MKNRMLFFAVNILTGNVELFITSYIPPSGQSGARFKYQRQNMAMDLQTKSISKSWSDEATRGQDGQLAYYLGKEWFVLSNYDTFKAIEKGMAGELKRLGKERGI